MKTRYIIPVTLFALPALVTGQGGGGGSGADIHVSGRFISDEPTGNPPLQVQSTTNVPNLSADKLDGFDVGDFATAGSGVGMHYKNLVGVPGGQIDQDCATGTGCFAGDSGGFPVTITEPGSYRLIGNLETTDENQTVIDIQTGHVVLDLNGFAIIGPTSCGGDPLSCTPVGTGRGVATASSNVAVINGTVTGMGDDGIHLTAEVHVTKVHVTSNGGDGAEVGDHGHLSNVIAQANGQNGIVAEISSIVTDSTAVNNGSDGLDLLTVRAVGNTASSNGVHGLACGGQCVVRDNHVYFNGDDGIRASDASVVVGNLVSTNTDDGIVSTFKPSTVRNNTVDSNGGIGLNLHSAAGYGGNVISGNGTNVSGGVEVGQNMCESDTTCP